MTRRIYIAFFFILLSLLSRAQEQYQISWDYSNLSFREFVSQAESHLEVRFFYKDIWIEDLDLFGKTWDLMMAILLIIVVMSL